MLDQIPTTAEMADACITARGGTLEMALDAIAWAYTDRASRPWSEDAHRLNRDSVHDHAAFICEAFSDYPHSVQFNDLKPHHRDELLRSVVASFHTDKDEVPLPILAGDHMLDGLRKARALWVQDGGHYERVCSLQKAALVALLQTQSVGVTLATHAIDHALIKGIGIHQAVAEIDGHL